MNTNEDYPPTTIEVTCPYCSIVYKISEEESLLRQIFNEDNTCKDCWNK